MDNQKISQLFSLPNLNFKTQMNISIDSNTHIKNILNVKAYIFDNVIDSVTNKCIVKGKIGVKILYLDTDNVYGTIVNENSFSESVASNDITADCAIMMYDEAVIPEIDFDEKYLKLNLTVNAKLFCNINLPINLPNLTDNNLVIQNETITTNHCIDKINSNILEECVYTLPFRANKILDFKILPSIEKIECNAGYIAITGNNLIQTIYETDTNNINEIKIHNENTNFKFEVASTSEADCLANCYLKINQPSINFSTELEENKTNIKLNYNLIALGFVFKKISLELVKDIYSTKNNIETKYSNREICSLLPFITYKANIEGEVQLIDNSADEILETSNYNSLITQIYIQENKIVLEGIASANIIYLTEQKEIKSMNTELPFSISKDFDYIDNCQILNFEIKPYSCKAKIKRGNALSLEFDTCVEGYCVKKENINMLETIQIGKSYDYNDITFQLVIAKQNESLWQFCKRTHTTIDDLQKNNTKLPPIFQGGEKLLIFR